MNKLFAYFDPYSHVREQHACATASTAEGNPALPWWPQYLALAAGVFIQPYLARYQVDGSWHFAGASGRVLFACFVAIIIFPAVFRKVIDEPKPMIVLVGPIFAAGLGWQTIAGAALKATQ